MKIIELIQKEIKRYQFFFISLKQTEKEELNKKERESKEIPR